MQKNFEKLRKDFSKKGHICCRKVFENNFVSKIINEINQSKNNIKYYDSSNNLVRIEKLYNQGKYLKDLNDAILTLFKKIFKKDFIIFKDKFNVKQPGGKGFFAHYDGVFKFKDHKNNLNNGWYKYGNLFITALIALDKCNKKNGTIEIANAHKGNFNKLLKNTKNDGTPAIKKEIVSKTSFNPINLDVGDVVFFSNTCPHRSKINNSKKMRRILYYTYSLAEYGSKYNEYFRDKYKSKNSFKALNNK